MLFGDADGSYGFDEMPPAPPLEDMPPPPPDEV